MAEEKTYYGTSDELDWGDWFGKNSFLSQNEGLFGLAGAGFKLWDGMQRRELEEKYAEENLKMNKQKLKMTQQSYNNELYRSNSIEDQLAGGKSPYTGAGGRQYVGPADTHPGYNPNAGTNPNAAAYATHQAGPAAGPSNYNATAYGPTNTNAANYAGGLAGASQVPNKKPNTL